MTAKGSGSQERRSASHWPRAALAARAAAAVPGTLRYAAKRFIGKKYDGMRVATESVGRTRLGLRCV